MLVLLVVEETPEVSHQALPGSSIASPKRRHPRDGALSLSLMSFGPGRPDRVVTPPEPATVVARLFLAR